MDTTEDPQEAVETQREPEEPKPIDACKLDHVYGCNDVGFKKFSNRRTFIGKNVKAFEDVRTPCAGTRELRKFLKEQSIPKAVLRELLPEEIETVSDRDMDMIYQRVTTLSNKSLDFEKDAPSPQRKSSPISTGGESLGQPGDSSSPEVGLDL